MSGKIEISRELIEVVAKEMDRLGYGHHEHHAESILCSINSAAPVVERQEPKGAILRFREYVGKGQGGRDLWHDWTEWSTGTVEYAKSKLDQVKDLTHIQFEVEWLYTSPPAPIADDMVRLLTRARIYARGEFRDEIDKCLLKVKRMNQ